MPQGATSMMIYPPFTRSGKYGFADRVSRPTHTGVYLSVDSISVPDSAPGDFLSEVGSYITNGAVEYPPDSGRRRGVGVWIILTPPPPPPDIAEFDPIRAPERPESYEGDLRMSFFLSSDNMGRWNNGGVPI